MNQFLPRMVGFEICIPHLGDIPHSLASIAKSSRLLGYNPQFNLRQGLEHSIKWYWEHLK